MLHHSFEHLPHPRTALRDIHRLLAPGGIALIRMPVVNQAWTTYGSDWVQLDPPRHLFLYTEAGFAKMAEESGFVIEQIVYDSGSMQFWGSEQYKLDIPLNDPRSHNRPKTGTIFSPEQIEDWEREAERLNEQGLGDQAAYYLTKKV
jgi:SAM-dependent methyltransferase